MTGLLAFALLIWGPIDHSSPYGLVVRIAYLIVLPAGAWLALSYVWQVWRPDAAAEDRLARTVAGALAGALFVGAYLASQVDSHLGCTDAVRTRDGYECVGDYEPFPGPDLREVVFLVAVGVAAAWYSVAPRTSGEAVLGAPMRGDTG